MSIFDQYSDLDPARMRRQVEVAHGAPLFDQYSHDAARAEVQMHAGVGASFDQFSLLDPEREQAQVDAALSGGGSYRAPSVHFDGSTYLSRASGLGSPSPYGLLSYWGKRFFSNGDDNNSSLGATPLLSAGFNLLAGSTNSNDPPAPAAATIGIYVADADFVGQFDFDTTDNAVFDDGWYHVIEAWNTNFASGSRVGAVYVNGILRPLTIKTDTGDASFNINYADAPVYWGSSNPGVKALVGDCADPYINVVDNFLQLDGTIDPAVRLLFRTVGGKPADPSGFPVNGLYLGGDSTTFGASAEFSVAAGTLTDATTSPSD